MVSVKTYLCDKADGLFPIETFSGSMAIEDAVDVFGAVELIVDYQPVMPRDYIDYINWLWPSLITATLELVRGRKAEFTYYEQYPHVVFEPIRAGTHVLITPYYPRPSSLTGKITTFTRACAEFRELTHNIVTAGYVYCEHIGKAFSHRCARELRDLGEIEAELRRRAS